jgi:iron complex transport system ATP-binding protein
MIEPMIETKMQTSFRLISDDLLVSFSAPRRVLSSAVLGGGFSEASFILNHWVQRDSSGGQAGACCEIGPSPREFIQNRIGALGITGSGVGLMTAVNIPKNLVVLHLGFEEVWVEGFFTVGVGNAVRAGDPASDLEEEEKARAGTVNMILLTNASLSDAAMVEALQVAAEAKTAAMMESGIKSTVSARAATGTGTDCTAVVSGGGAPVRYAGTHTKMGELIGRLVSEGLLQGLKKCEKR